jgi:hypothetical protein
MDLFGDPVGVGGIGYFYNEYGVLDFLLSTRSTPKTVSESNNLF